MPRRSRTSERRRSRAIPECEGEHAHEAPDGRLQPPLLDGGEHHLGVAVPAKAVPEPLEFVP